MPGRKIENDGRLEEVLDLWRKGIPSRRIQADLAPKYHVTYRQIRRYIAKVEKMVAARQAEELPGKRAKIAEAVESYLERTIDAGDLRCQGIALERLMKLYVPEAPRQLSVAPLDVRLGPHGMTPEQEMARLEELLALKAAEEEAKKPK